MEVTAQILGEFPLFKGLKEEQLALIATKATHQQYVTGAFIFKEGEDARICYIIRHGMVALQMHSPERGAVSIQTLREREVLGLSWLFSPQRWMFDARALELTRVIAVDGQFLREQCEADHELGYEVMKRLTFAFGQRLQATRLQLLDVYGSSHRRNSGL